MTQVWQAPAGWPPAPRRGPSRRAWVAIGASVVALFLLPFVVVAAVVVHQQRQESQPPQSTYDDTRDLGQLLQRVAEQGDAVAAQPVRVAVDRGADGVRTARVVDAPGGPYEVRLGEGNGVEVTGTYGAFCVTVTHEGETPVRWDSRWSAVQSGPSTDGACR